MIRTMSLCRRLINVFILVTGVASGQATARTFAGVSMPDTMTVDGNRLQLNGMGLRSFTMLQIHGYVAGLYLLAPAHHAEEILNQPGMKLLRVQFVRSAGVDRIRDELQQEHNKICASGCPSINDSAFAQLLNSVRAVKPDDIVTYIFGSLGVKVLFNGELVTMIQNADFSRRMFDGMIGSHPPTEALRDGLIGESAK